MLTQESSKSLKSQTFALKPQQLNLNINQKIAKINFKSKTNNPSPLKTQQKQIYTEESPWIPKIKTKKLNEQPMFFLSVQRKKIRIINSQRTSNLKESQNNNYKNFQGCTSNLLKQRAGSLRKQSENVFMQGKISKSLKQINTQRTEVHKIPIINLKVEENKKVKFKSDPGFNQSESSSRGRLAFNASQRIFRTRSTQLQKDKAKIKVQRHSKTVDRKGPFNLLG